jgi:hypothetical protein
MEGSLIILHWMGEWRRWRMCPSCWRAMLVEVVRRPLGIAVVFHPVEAMEVEQVSFHERLKSQRGSMLESLQAEAEVPPEAAAVLVCGRLCN